jgi:hypothetical protein
MKLMIRPDKAFKGTSMTIPAEEEIFVLSDEIIDQIYSYFPRSDSQHDRTIQACMALQALINVISIMLCEIDSEFAIKAVIDSFTEMLKDLPAIRAEVEHEQKAQSIQ